MSHIARYKINLKNFNYEYAKRDTFLKTLEKVLRSVLNINKIVIEKLSGFVRVRVYSEEYVTFSIVFTDKGEIIVRGDTDNARKLNLQEITRIVHQSIVASVQLARYKNFRVRMMGNKLVAEAITG